MAAAVAPLIPTKVLGIDTLGIIRSFTAMRHRSPIAVVGMKMGVDVATELVRTVEPRAGSDEDAINKPFGTIVAGGSTGIRSDVIVPVGTIRRRADFDGNLSFRHRSSKRQREKNR